VPGHVGRFLVFARRSDQIGLIVAVQVPHGICYAFFFVALYVFYDTAFTRDVRTRARGFSICCCSASAIWRRSGSHSAQARLDRRRVAASIC